MRAELLTYLERWGLRLDGPPFETHSSLLAYVDRDTTQAVLKIPKPNSDELQGARILMHWGEAAAVRVLEHDERALLIERAMPGDTLADFFHRGEDDEATRVWCDIVRRLHTAPAPQAWPSVEERGRSFLAPPTDHPSLPAALIASARAEYFELCATQSARRYLLHGDLNHHNILRDRNCGWVVIDPKGCVGELEWETAALLRNPDPHWTALADPRRMERRVRILGERLGLNEQRVLRWCAAQAVLSCIWSAEDHGDEDMMDAVLKIGQTATLLLRA